jgi:hypothetical protein
MRESEETAPAKPVHKVNWAALFVALVVLMAIPAIAIVCMVQAWRHPPAAHKVSVSAGERVPEQLPASVSPDAKLGNHSGEEQTLGPSGDLSRDGFTISAWYLPDEYAWPTLLPQAGDGIGALLIGFDDYFDTPRTTTLVDLHVQSGRLKPGSYLDVRQLEHPLLSHGDGRALYVVDTFWEQKERDPQYKDDRANVHLRWWPRLPDHEQLEYLLQGCDREDTRLAAALPMDDGTLSVLTHAGTDYQYGNPSAQGWQLWKAGADGASASQALDWPEATWVPSWQHNVPAIGLHDATGRFELLEPTQYGFRSDAVKQAQGMTLLAYSHGATAGFKPGSGQLTIDSGGKQLVMAIRNPYTHLPDGSPRKVAYNYGSTQLDHMSSKPYVREQAQRFRREGRLAPLDRLADGYGENGATDETRHEFVRAGIYVMPCGPRQFAVADSANQRILLVTCPD